MSHYIEKVTVSLENLISELARNPSLFLKNPDTDFSRNRKINFKTCVGITMNSGGCTLNKELLDFFDFDVNAPTVSAYTQQRAKILPEAFEYLFHAFTEENAQTKKSSLGNTMVLCQDLVQGVVSETQCIKDEIFAYRAESARQNCGVLGIVTSIW